MLRVAPFASPAPEFLPNGMHRPPAVIANVLRDPDLARVQVREPAAWIDPLAKGSAWPGPALPGGGAGRGSPVRGIY